MAFTNVIQRLQQLQVEVPAEEARHLHGNLIALLKGKWSNKMAPVVKSALRKKPKRVLEIGCGYGALALFFAMQGIDVTGIDVKTKALEACGTLAELLKIRNIALVRMDACAISLSGFDMAISTDFYEHLPYESQPEHLRSVLKALNPGGVYIIRAPHRSDITQHRTEHIGLPSFYTLRQQAADAGFTVRFGIAHTALVSPVNYHIPLEQWLESRKWSKRAIYKGLQKCGLANIVAYLEKQAP